MPLSAVDCIQPAIQHAREQLFRPFRFGQWARLALIGILAGEAHSGGCSYSHNFNVPNRQSSPDHIPWHLPRGFGSVLQSRISEHIGQIVGLIIIAVAVFFVIGLVFLYLNSVFRFILFDSVVRRQCAIEDSWGRWHHAGRRFFLWQIVFQIAASLFLGLLIGLPLAAAFAAGWTNDLREHLGRLILGIIALVILFLVFAVIAGVVQVLARDFLVPIMALENLDFADGWSRLMAIMRPERGRFAGYILLKVVLAIAAAIIFGILSIFPALLVITPSVAAVLAAKAAGLGWNVTTISLIIILGTVALILMIYLIALVCVPATVFFPAYALYFLSARYPQLDALLHPAPVAPAPVAPPVPETLPPLEPPPLPPSPELI